MWDQSITPWRVTSRDLLWSPANIGSFAVRSQVITLHDIAPIDHPDWFSKSIVSTYKFFLPAIVRRVRHVVTVSNFSAERIHKVFGVGYDRMSVIPNGVDDDFFQCASAAPPQACIDCEGNLARYVFFLARPHDARKNAPIVLKAWENGLSSFPPDLMLFVGGMDAPEGSDPLVLHKKRIRFLGKLSDQELKGLLGHARAFLFPSLYEGFGLPPLEALAAGVPVIASNYTSVPEVVGDAAILFDPTNAEELADAINRVVRSDVLSCHLRSSGIARARGLSWDSTAAKTLTLLKNV